MTLNTISAPHTEKKNIAAADQFQTKALQWAQQFEEVCFLDHNKYTTYPSQMTEGYLACGTEKIITVALNEEKALSKLQGWLDENEDWAFGFLSYELKNQIENLSSTNPATIAFPLLTFFVPKFLIEFRNSHFQIIKSKISEADLIEEIDRIVPGEKSEKKRQIKLKTKFSKAEYLNTVKQLQNHIQLGDIYEVNFCQEFYSSDVDLDPVILFDQLNKNSRAPFAAFFKSKDKYILCSSPERFLQKKGSRLISQPIKGTRPRGESFLEDAALKAQLMASAKDHSEHVMIVDLVRNDLGRCCQPGSVEVPELYSIYSFEHVHQMISLVQGTVLPNTNFQTIIESTFPMGSMTGAPKISALKLIEQYERSARGVYSGSIGYIKPNGDFDFNVVIRAMLYDQQAKLLSFQVGGAIVADSNPEEEFQECLVKSAGIRQALFGSAQD